MGFTHARRDTFISMKCVQCGSIAVYNHRMIVRPLFHHLYKCQRCKAEIASPTTYLQCDKYGIIVRDTVTFDCFLCPYPKIKKFDPRKTRCEYLAGGVEIRDKLGRKTGETWRPVEIPYDQIEAHITKQTLKQRAKIVKERDESKYEKGNR